MNYDTLETKNAVITSTTLSVEDYGCLSSFLNLDYGGSGQGFGGYALYAPKYPSAGAGLWIWRILEVLEIGRWENLPGTVVRVQMNRTAIEALGHALKDQWFRPRLEFAALEEKYKVS